MPSLNARNRCQPRMEECPLASPERPPLLSAPALSEGASPADWMAPPLSKAELVEDSIAEAIARHASTAPAEAAPEKQSAPADRTRLYSLPEVTVLLGAAATLLLALESEALASWARRMEVGPVQSVAAAALRAIQTAMEPIGLTGPRRTAIELGNRVARVLGAGDDPLLADGWHDASRSPALPVKPLDPQSVSARAPVPEARPATAQTTPDSAEAGKALETTPAPTRKTVLLLGDSMIAGSLGSAIALSLSSDPNQRLVRAVQTATGINRPDVFNWMKVIPPLLERENPQLIVCSLGANDATDIRDGDRVLEFAQAGWRRTYSERVVSTMRLLARPQARVLWLGLPPMRERAFSERARYLNGIFAQAAKEVPQVEYFDLETLVAAPNGEYATFLRNEEGRFARMRMEDGVHYAPAGARWIARWVIDWIYERRNRLSDARQ